MSNLIIDLCQKVIKGGIDTCKTWGEGECTGIRCEQDHCPFAYGLLCNLGNENKRVEIANKYLFENGIEVEEDNKMQEKTFREVIADIKEGETWVNVIAPISYIRLRENGVLDFNENEGVNLNCKYTLRRKEYTFAEAFKAYEEGAEIESNLYRYKRIDNEDTFFNETIKDWYMIPSLNIELSEIRGTWYINN